MSYFKKISASLFASVAYAILVTTGWKRKTVEANLNHVAQGSWNQEEKWTDHNHLYRKLLNNLTQHVGELLFCFDIYKNLPDDHKEYPYRIGNCNFELGAGTGEIIERMRKGGIFLTAHYGNYEASGAWLCALGVPLKASFIPLKPAWLNKFVYEKIRCVRGRPYSINARTPREFLEQLDGRAADCHGQKQLFCLLADQDSRIPSAQDGTFLGQPAKINPLPDFLLKHRPDTPVFFCWIEEQGNRRILHAVEANFNKLDFRLHENNNSIVDRAYRSWLEERIRENPSLWYGWTHRRFRSKNPEIYH